MKHTIIYFFSRLVTGSVGLLSIYLLTRLLSVEEYKNYAVLIAIITFISGVSYQWLVISSSRLFLEYQDKRNDFIKSIIILFSLSSLLVTLLVFLSTYIYPEITYNKYLLLMFIIFMLGLYTLFIKLVNIMQKPFIYSLLNSVRSITSLLIAIILIYYFNIHETGALIGFGVGFLFSVALFIFYFKKPIVSVVTSLRQKTDYKIIPLLVNYGVPLSFTYLAILLINVSDRLMLGKMSSALEVTSYSATYDVTQQTVGVLMNILFLSYFPKILQTYTENNIKKMSHNMYQLGDLLILTMTIVIVIYSLSSNAIASFMFAQDIASSTVGIMPIIAIAISIGTFKSYFLDIAFQLKKDTKTQLYITLCMAVLNIFLNLFFIPLYGAFGAAVSTLLSFLMGGLLSWKYASKLIKFPNLLLDIIKIFLSGILIFLINYYLHIDQYNIILQIFLILLGFSIFIIMFNIMEVRAYVITKLTRKNYV